MRLNSGRSLIGARLSVLDGRGAGAGFGVLPPAWLLPVGGFFIGFITNWIAINLIFAPVRPAPGIVLAVAGAVPASAG